MIKIKERKIDLSGIKIINFNSIEESDKTASELVYNQIKANIYLIF